MRSWTKQNTLTFIIIFTLLVVDISQSLLILLYDNVLGPSTKLIYAEQFKFWIPFLYRFMFYAGFPLIVLVIKINQSQLQKMNMDKLCVIMVAFWGFAGLLFLPLNCLAVIALIFTVHTLFNKDAKFAVFDYSSLRINLLFVAIFAGVLIYAINFRNAENNGTSFEYFLLETIPFAVYEEVVFRGVLYMLLKDFGFSESKSFFIQAFLFWISHISDSLAFPFFFWVILPILSLIFGYIARRSKVLTPGAIVHVLYNAIARFF